MAVHSVFEPRVSQDGGFTPITVVVQQLFLCLDVSGSHQDQVRAAINGVKPGLAVSGFTVVDESPKALRLLRSVHTENKDLNGHIKRLESTLGVIIQII